MYEQGLCPCPAGEFFRLISDHMRSQTNLPLPHPEKEFYKEKNETLTDLVAQYKKGYEESRTLREELGECRRTITTLEKELANEHGNLESLARINEERLRQQEEKHKSELERAVERRDIENERELLRVRTEYQAQLQAAAQETTSEIRGLYERIERLRGEHEQTIENIRGDHEK